MIGTLIRRAIRRPEAVGSPPALSVTVYTRASCGCCRKALDVLRAFQPRYGFTLDLIDVDTDPALAEEHGRTVPVVAVNGKVRFRGVVNPVLLERLLRAQTAEGP